MASDVKNQFQFPVLWRHARISSVGGLCRSLRQWKVGKLSLYSVYIVTLILNSALEKIFATLTTKKDLEPKYGPQLPVRSLLGCQPVSHWVMFCPVPCKQSQKSLRKLTRPSLLMVFKVASDAGALSDTLRWQCGWEVSGQTLTAGPPMVWISPQATSWTCFLVVLFYDAGFYYVV